MTGGWTSTENLVRKVAPPREPWMDAAACRGAGPSLFFADEPAGRHYRPPAPGEPTPPTHRARMICAGCPVREECLDYALTHNERGIWGGTSDRDRRTIKRHRRIKELT